MKTVAWQRTTLLVALAMVAEASALTLDNSQLRRSNVVGDDYTEKVEPYDYINVADEEYIRYIYSMYDGHRGDLGGRVETIAPIDNKYRAWKRNADLINSLLALPKGLMDAGR